MEMARSDSTPASVDTVIASLKTQGIAFHGPFQTQGRRVIFVVHGYILLDSELVTLLEQNKLNRGGILELAERLEPRPQ